MSNQIIEELIAKGVSSDTIVAVARLIADAEITNARRAADVVRKRNSRGRNPRVRGNPQTSADIRGNDKPITETIEELANVRGHPRKSADPPVHILTPHKKDPSDLSISKTRGSRLQSDWQPDAEGVSFAEGLLGASWRFEAEKFRDYWQARPGSGGIKNDWAATWRNWCRNAVERKPSNGKFNGHASKPSVSDVLARLCDETGPDPDWLLPQIGSERS